MDLSRLLSTWGSIGLVLISTITVYLAVVAFTRLSGPRSLGSMSSFDFAAIVAVGSTIATVASLGAPLVHGIVAVGVLYLAQLGAASLRRWHSAARAFDNRPLLLMHDGTVLEGNLRTARVSHAELYAELRQSGVTDLDDVGAAVLETTGSISVLRGNGRSPIDVRLLAGVRGSHRFAGGDEG